MKVQLLKPYKGSPRGAMIDVGAADGRRLIRLAIAYAITQWRGEDREPIIEVKRPRGRPRTKVKV